MGHNDGGIWPRLGFVNSIYLLLLSLLLTYDGTCWIHALLRVVGADCSLSGGSDCGSMGIIGRMGGDPADDWVERKIGYRDLLGKGIRDGDGALAVD